jgi:phenylpropionate dioxygenase-like ring-hydroxylating dioxygenase large terminal subunit
MKQQLSAALSSDLDHGMSLPASWFTDPAIVEREFDRIFHRTWQYFCRAEQLVKVGDFVVGMAGRIPIVVVRNDRGLGAYVNVCRHRRHLVMSGCGSRKTMQCAYHGWTYGLDGHLQSAPRCEGDDGFKKEDFPLLSARVDTWGPFVFVNADMDARPLTDYVGELPQIITQCGLDLDSAP